MSRSKVVAFRVDVETYEALRALGSPSAVAERFVREGLDTRPDAGSILAEEKEARRAIVDLKRRIASAAGRELEAWQQERRGK